MARFPLDAQFNRDLVDFIAMLQKAGVQYVVVGGYAVMAHSQSLRPTKDLDVYVDAAPENLSRLAAALAGFGAPQNIIDECGKPPSADGSFAGFTFGRPPARIDVLTRMEVTFIDLVARAQSFEHDVLKNVQVIGKDDLVAMKKTANRKQDREDIRALQRPKRD